ncbi:MAG TPA: hypothetical protein VJ805_14505 [Nitrospiraceae bacterium]|nr:hypothetical protein [Nitrospiraceae bacterium]
MTTVQDAYAKPLRSLAELMLSVAGESVGMVKRNAPQRAMKLKRKEEWTIYLEFMKILFNLADRISVLHVPVKDQPQFMDGLEDQVTAQLKQALQPALEAGSDQTEIVLTIGAAVAESRQVYEQYRFLISEDSKPKNEMFREFGERIAELAGVPGNAQVISAATLCVSAAVPAIQAILEGRPAADGSGASANPNSHTSGHAADRAATGSEIKLVSVMSSVNGEEVETRWGLHPRFRQDLHQDESQQLTKLMNRVAKILGERYAAVAFTDHWASWHRAGHA